MSGKGDLAKPHIDAIRSVAGNQSVYLPPTMRKYLIRIGMIFEADEAAWAEHCPRPVDWKGES